MTIAVLGALGYGGRTLMRLLLGHGAVDRLLPVSSSRAGESLFLHDPGLSSRSIDKLPYGETLLSREQAVSAAPDAVFSALPHGHSADFCEPFFRKSVVFDLSADFRLSDPAEHERVYGHPPPRTDLRNQAVYGLVEVHRESLKTANLVALPGCYPTCSLLPLLPLSSILKGPVVINALSGISGAGRKAQERFLFVERSENATAYDAGRRHRHLSEMIQELGRADCRSSIFFTPHLVPMRRGMAATITAVPTEKAAAGGAKALETLVGESLEKFHADNPFVVLVGDRIPATRDVLGSNRCDIGWRVEQAGDGMLIYLFSVIDNLLKGAAGQAVQAFNIRFGFAERSSLPQRGEV